MKYMRIEANIWFKKYVLIDVITVGKWCTFINSEHVIISAYKHFNKY